MGKKVVVNEIKDITWREYRAFSKALREITPDDEGVSLDEMRSLMLVAAIRAGWFVDQPAQPEFSWEDMDDWTAKEVIIPAEKVAEHYELLRTPDPN
jgi:hypothetical protein